MGNRHFGKCGEVSWRKVNEAEIRVPSVPEFPSHRPSPCFFADFSTESIM